MKEDLEKIVEPTFMQVSASLVKSGVIDAVKGTYTLARDYVIGSLPQEVKESIFDDGSIFYHDKVREVTNSSASIQALLVTPAIAFGTAYHLSSGDVGTSVGVTIIATVIETAHSGLRTENGDAYGHLATVIPYYALKAAAYIACAPIYLSVKAFESGKEKYTVRKEKVRKRNDLTPG